MVQRELKRTKMVNKFAAKRNALRELIANPETSFDDKMEAVEKLSRLPRDSAKTRQHNRCALTGRPHGYYRKFGLGRNKLRELAMRGDVPGLTKASW
jgi:small subunit ribosomal protein S14